MYAAFEGWRKTGNSKASSTNSTPTKTQPPGSFKSPAELKSYQGILRGAAEVSDFALLTEYTALTVNKKLAPKACAVRNRFPAFIGLLDFSSPTPKYPCIFLVLCFGLANKDVKDFRTLVKLKIPRENQVKLAVLVLNCYFLELSFDSQ